MKLPPKRKQIPGERVKVLGVKIAGWPRRIAMALPPKRFDDRYQRPLNMNLRPPRRVAPEIEDEDVAEDDDIEGVDENGERDGRTREIGGEEKVERSRKRSYGDMENGRKVDSRSLRENTCPRAPKRRQKSGHSPSPFVTKPGNRTQKLMLQYSHHRHDTNVNHDSDDYEDSGSIPFPSPKPQTVQLRYSATRRNRDRRDGYDSEAQYYDYEDTHYEYQDKNISPSMPRPQDTKINSTSKSGPRKVVEETRDFFWAPAMKIPAIVHDMTGAQPSRLQFVGPSGSEVIDFPDMLTELERQLGSKLSNTTFVRSDELSDLLMAFQKKTAHIEVLEADFKEMAAESGAQEDVIKRLRSQLKGWKEGYTNGNRYKNIGEIHVGVQQSNFGGQKAVRAKSQEAKPRKQVKVKQEVEGPRKYDEQPRGQPKPRRAAEKKRDYEGDARGRVEEPRQHALNSTVQAKPQPRCRDEEPRRKLEKRLRYE